MELMNVEETARMLRLQPTSLYVTQFRERLGLNAIRLGKRLLFRRSDVLAVIERHVEQFRDKPEGNDV